LIAMGDSITSGHHRLSSDSATVCEDNSYGYAAAYAAKFRAALPTQWRSASDYINVAWSGASTTDILSPTGGTDACQHNIPISQIGTAQRLLTTQSTSGSWDQVVATGGIDDTNWVNTVKKIVAANASSWTVNHSQLPESACDSILSGWDGQQQASTITTNVALIVHDLRRSDPAVRIRWIGYYNVANTGLPFIPKTSIPGAPSTCTNGFDRALGLMRSAVTQGLGGNAGYIDSDQVMRENGSYVQPLLWPIDPAARQWYAGWPHPDDHGAKAITGLINTY
jgi:hypothetical protein